MQLPLGPSTTALRRLLAAQPILADPSDAEALEREESTSLFLIQMPSDLRFSSILKSTNSSSSAETNSKKNKISSARLGKMQLLKSGKVRMVTDDGKVYEVSSGLAASFQHCLMSINCPAEATATNASTQGSLCVMGNITKKLVITPTMEDYMETLQSQKSSSTAHLQPLDVEDVDGEGEEGGMVVDVNDN